MTIPLGFATLDLDRERRQGLPEVVFAPGKDPDQIVAIARELLARSLGPVLVTRVDAATARYVGAAVSGGVHDESARLLYWRPAAPVRLRVAVVTAGTADGAVAAEAVAVATAIGLQTELIADVGVAGLHRLLERLPDIEAADVVIVVAGMEGALASVVGGLVAAPVVAVPTSTGYGAALEGVTALLAMLSSCSAGVAVVNIDSGFGAAMAAHRLAQAMLARSNRAALDPAEPQPALAHSQSGPPAA
jgi:NCAIR mutase (PurE)-related protein